MTKDQALQTIEAILIDESIKGFTVKQVLLIQQALLALKAKESPESSAAQSQPQ